MSAGVILPEILIRKGKRCKDANVIPHSPDEVASTISNFISFKHELLAQARSLCHSLQVTNPSCQWNRR